VHKGDKIFVAGHRGLVGSALVRALQRAGHTDVVTRTRGELDLQRQEPVERFFESERPAYVFLAAGKVGGILANDRYGGDFIRDNLQIVTNIVDASHRSGVGKLLFLGSSCIYPRHAPQPMREDSLLTGPLEPTNEPYAIAKIAGIRMVQAYRRQFGMRGISVMPTNLFGPGDHFDLKTSHVLPALLRKMHEAKVAGHPEVVIWGSGAPRREFLHVDDLADACLFLMDNYEGEEIINIGVGEDLSISQLAALVAQVVGFTGGLTFDASKPDGTPRKLLDVSRIHSLGWRARIGLRRGIEETYKWFLAHEQEILGGRPPLESMHGPSSLS
jgi:GDP-L-fucose synthase